jgi:hypothetical protein
MLHPLGSQHEGRRTRPVQFHAVEGKGPEAAGDVRAVLAFSDDLRLRDLRRRREAAV